MINDNINGKPRGKPISCDKLELKFKVKSKL